MSQSLRCAALRALIKAHFVAGKRATAIRRYITSKGCNAQYQITGQDIEATMTTNDFAKQLKKAEGQIKSVVRKASARSLNRAAQSTRAFMAREIRKDLNVKSGDIKSLIKFNRVKASTPVEDQVARIETSFQSIPLFKFAAKPKKVRTHLGARFGASVKVGRQRKLVKGATFIATIKSGYTGVFRRTGSDSKLEHLYGPSVAGVLSSDKVQAVVLKHARERVIAEFKTNYQYYLSQLGSK